MLDGDFSETVRHSDTDKQRMRQKPDTKRHSETDWQQAERNTGWGQNVRQNQQTNIHHTVDRMAG